MVIHNHVGLSPLAPHHPSPCHIYAPLVINGLNRHLDRYVMFQTFLKLHRAKNGCYTLQEQNKIPVTFELCQSDGRAIGSSNITQSDHPSDYRTFGT